MFNVRFVWKAQYVCVLRLYFCSHSFFIGADWVSEYPSLPVHWGGVRQLRAWHASEDKRCVVVTDVGRWNYEYNGPRWWISLRIDVFHLRTPWRSRVDTISCSLHCSSPHTQRCVRSGCARIVWGMTPLEPLPLEAVQTDGQMEVDCIAVSRECCAQMPVMCNT
jgi:hypothetical protein